ncbi:hypothetical protein [Agrobacterium sp. CG674]
MTDTTDNVISFGSRRPFAQVQAEIKAETEAAIQVAEEAKSAAVVHHKETLLKMLSEVTALVEKDQLEGLIILGRHVETKLFYTDIALDARLIPAHDYFAYVGLLETVKLELADTTAMAPSLMPDGTVLSPHVVVVDEEGEILE